MKTSRKWCRYRNSVGCAGILSALCTLIPAREASAFCGGNPNPRIIPPHAKPYGASYGEWSAKWWQWAYSLPVSDNPFFDETGCDNGANGQEGSVWFLTGVLNLTGTAVRDCTIPHGKALFFPIINAEWDNYCPPIDPPLDEEGLRDTMDAVIDSAVNLTCEIDGKSIEITPDYRVQSPVFSVDFPDDNVFQLFGCDVPAGTYELFVADGYFLMVAPLSAGEHTIHYSGDLPAFGFSLDITYNLTVE